MPISERKKEIKRRRHRRKKMEHYKQKLTKANESEKTVIVQKLRDLTPGAENIISNWDLDTK